MSTPLSAGNKAVTPAMAGIQNRPDEPAAAAQYDATQARVQEQAIGADEVRRRAQTANNILMDTQSPQQKDMALQASLAQGGKLGD